MDSHQNAGYEYLNITQGGHEDVHEEISKLRRHLKYRYSDDEMYSYLPTSHIVKNYDLDENLGLDNFFSIILNTVSCARDQVRLMVERYPHCIPMQLFITKNVLSHLDGSLTKAIYSSHQMYIMPSEIYASCMLNIQAAVRHMLTNIPTLEN